MSNLAEKTQKIADIIKIMTSLPEVEAVDIIVKYNNIDFILENFVKKLNNTWNMDEIDDVLEICITKKQLMENSTEVVRQLLKRKYDEFNEPFNDYE